MSLEHYIQKGSKNLRFGYTTGTCAALAAGAALQILLTGCPPEEVSVMTARGIPVEVPLSEYGLEKDAAWAGIPKDAGDDADITDGMLICARVSLAEEPGVAIDGGEGVGRVTRPGLDQPVGNAAINSGPRAQITEQVSRVLRDLNRDPETGVRVTIFVPGGREAARKTFNASLGIEGGLSILGTTGIVEPMSERALVDTIRLEMKQDGLRSDCLVLTPGNYGSHYIEEHGLDRLTDGQGTVIPVLKFSNFLGETLDMLGSRGIRSVLLVAHAGKLVKAAGGIMNTHSRWADCRREILCAHAAVRGGSADLCRALMEAATTDACFDLLKDADLMEPVVERVLQEIQRQLEKRAGEEIRIGAVMFSNVHGTLGETGEAAKLLKEWKKEG